MKYDFTTIIDREGKDALAVDKCPIDGVTVKESFDKILGKSEKLGTIKSIAKTPEDIYANENPNCSFMLDCLRSELDTDIAIMNSASIRNRFSTGDITSRDLEDISPFTDKIVIIEKKNKDEKY